MYWISSTVGSSSTVSINGYIQAGYGNLFLDQILSDDLSVGTGVSYKVTLSSNHKICYTVQDTSDSTEHSVCANW